MDKFEVKKTEDTSNFLVDPEKGLIEIRGACYRAKFEKFDEILNALKEYFKNPKKITTVKIEVKYFNSDTARFFYKFFSFLESQAKKGHKIVISWIYDSDFSEEEGGEQKKEFDTLDIHIIKNSKKELEKMFKNDEVLFFAKGELISFSYAKTLTQMFIQDAIDNLEEVEREEDIHIPKKLFFVFIEIAQNMMNYKLRYQDFKALLLIGENEDNYYVFSKNLITKEDKEHLEDILNHILNMNKSQIKEEYKENRKNKKQLGLLEIAKLSDKIEFQFEPFEDKFIFILKVYVKK